MNKITIFPKIFEDSVVSKNIFKKCPVCKGVVSEDVFCKNKECIYGYVVDDYISVHVNSYINKTMSSLGMRGCSTCGFLVKFWDDKLTINICPSAYASDNCSKRIVRACIALGLIRSEDYE